jgi:hypothetical protein
MALGPLFNHRLTKKGVFFTILSITFVSLIMLLTFDKTNEGASKEKEFANSQFAVFDGFSRDVSEVYVGRVLSSQSTIAIAAILEYINTTHKNISNVNAVYRELMFNGSINNVHQQLMKNNLSNWTYLINNKSLEYLKIKTNITFYKVYLTQTDPWHVNAFADVSVLTEKDDLDYFVNKTINTTIPLIGFKDPMYLFNNKFNIIKPRVVLTGWKASTRALNVTMTREMILNKTYIHTNISPSFLMRLVNDSRPSVCCGIESLVMSSSDIDRSYVDYLYFNNDTASICSSTCLYNYTGLSDHPAIKWFKLDVQHEEKYGIKVPGDRIGKVCGSCI